VTGSHNGGFTNFTGTVSVADGKSGDAHRDQDRHGLKLGADADKLNRPSEEPGLLRRRKKFPTTTFTVTGIETADGGQKVTGNLALHGVTNSIFLRRENRSCRRPA